MTDRLWNQVFEAMLPLVRPDDVVAAPVGGWPPFGAAMQSYKGRIQVDGVTVLLLHKGQLAAIRKHDLAAIWRDWQCVFANNVFICFTRDRRVALDRRLTLQRRFTRLLWDYLHAASLKRRPGTVFFLHIPKTAGTSIWHALGRRVRSKIYYDCMEAFLFNPPLPGEYDLVGGHIPLHMMQPHVGPADHLVGLLRHPTDRFRSAFLHCRREAEDAAAFTAQMRAMRATTLRGFLATPDGQREVRQQLLMLGQAFGQRDTRDCDAAILAQAIAAISRPGALFLPADTMHFFVGRVSRMLDIASPRLRALNPCDASIRPGSAAEFADAIPLVASINAAERELYAFVERRTACQGWRADVRIVPAATMALTMRSDPF